MNKMHENLQVTNGVYGIFSNLDVQEKVLNLSRPKQDEPNYKELFEKIEMILSNLNSPNN